MTSYVIIDTETTGLAHPITACEIAWVVIDENLNVLDQEVHLTDPEQAIHPGAEAVHGLSWESVKGKPNNATICKMLPRPILWIGYQCSYDIGVIGEHVEFTDSLCVLALARRWIKGTTNHKLSTLKTELKLSDQASHSALGDCLTTLEVLQHIVNLTGKSLPELIDRDREPAMLNSMPFGMHKGRPFDLIPRPYKEWLLSREIPRDLRYTLERTLII
jgi:DNA polymerase III epsilon subunit-like protein